MPARPSTRLPWFHAPSGFWCAQIAGKRHYLDRDPIAAQRKLKQLLQAKRRGLQEWLDAPFSDLAVEFLTDIKARKAPATYSSLGEGEEECNARFANQQNACFLLADEIQYFSQYPPNRTTLSPPRPRARAM